MIKTLLSSHTVIHGTADLNERMDGWKEGRRERRIDESEWKVVTTVIN